MKLILFILLLVGCNVVNSQTKWEYIDYYINKIENETVYSYIDISSIKYSVNLKGETTCRFWCKWEYEGSLRYIKKLDYNEINCSQRTNTVLSSTLYFYDGHNYTSDMVVTDLIIPDTVPESMLTYICQ